MLPDYSLLLVLHPMGILASNPGHGASVSLTQSLSRFISKDCMGKLKALLLPGLHLTC